MFGLFKPKKKHIWKETARENLGSFFYMGDRPWDFGTKYRIAIYEKCLLTGETRIREIHDDFEVK